MAGDNPENEELKAVAERLRASEARATAILRGSPYFIVRIRADGLQLDVENAGALGSMFGEEQLKTIVGRRVGEFVSPERAAAIGEVIAEVLKSGEPRTVTHDFVTGDAHLFYEARLVPFAAGEVLAFVRDVTEDKKLRDRLLLGDRMASLGTLVAGMAHEINNPLAFVMANLQYAVGELSAMESAAALGDKKAAIVEALGEARAGAERVSRIVAGLRVFSRGLEDDKREPVALRALIDSALQLAQHEVRHRARLVRDFAGAPVVEANANRLEQVFLNLLMNAAQAIPVGHADENEIRVSLRKEGDEAIVEVRDTGEGIAVESLPRLFDPFFTTRDVGVGTGLGLSVCHGVVRSLGGHIEVESELGRGSLFRVRLPASPASVKPAPPPPSERVEAVQRGRVLVVDDEPSIGTAIKRLLLGLHDVEWVESGAEAIERLASEEYDVIFCDLMMPDMTGVELFGRLAKVLPEAAARVCFITGGPFVPGANRFVHESGRPLVQKPFSRAQLLSAMAEVEQLLQATAANG